MSDYWNHEYGWDWDRQTNYLLTQILVSLASVRIINVEDMFSWPYPTIGLFYCNSAYKALLDPENATEENISWNKIWKIQGQFMCNFFLWLSRHHRLLTDKNKFDMGLLESSTCSLCKQAQGSQIHILINCLEASIIWHHLIRDEFFLKKKIQLPFKSWLYWNLKSHLHKVEW